MSQRALERLAAKFPDDVIETHAQHGDETAVVRPAALRAVAGWLRDDPDAAFDMLTDLTAIDLLPREPRFYLVVHLYSTRHRHRLRLKAPLDSEAPSAPSLTPIWRGAGWFEREAWDMYGVRFDGHPDLRRILLYEAFEGHPLRKDYAKDRHQPLYRRNDDANA